MSGGLTRFGELAQTMNLLQAFDDAIQHHQSGRLAEAEAGYRQVLSIQPRHAGTLHLLGVVRRQRGQNEDAVELIRQSIALEPGIADFHCNLGAALVDLGRVHEAIAAFRRALQLQPESVEARNNLGNALRDTGHLGEAIAALREAIAIKPGYPEAHSNLGNALREMGYLDDAIASYRQSIALNPGLAEAHSNLGTALGESGCLDESLNAFRKAITIQPHFPEAHRNLAHALLLRGNFSEGWLENEWRWKCGDFTSLRRDFSQPPWEGGPLEGRTILLHSEQGIGDAIQFIRYLPMVVERGARVIIQCQPQIKRLVQIMAPDLMVLDGSEILPPFDTHCPLLSLPRVFATDLTNIPQGAPYLCADSGDVANWRSRLADDSHLFKVGIVWAGNPEFRGDRMRSPRRLSLFSPLGRVEGAGFFSLQKGEAATQARTPPDGMTLHDWTDDLQDFADTAALIENLDLVITSDTSVAHLAGAMGRPVWVLLPFVCDWRWLRNRSDSPWYPTMRLFRQRRPNEWEPVVEEVKLELEALVRSRG